MNRKKRILFLVSSMQGGGAERVASLLCNAWAAEGHKVVLMPTFSTRVTCVYPLTSGVRLEFLADRVNSTKNTFWAKLMRLWAIRQAISYFSTDVVVSFLTNVNIAAIIAAKTTHVPVIVSERNYPPLMSISPFLSIMRRLTYPWATYVITQTDRGKEWIKTHCPSSRVRVIPNPIILPLPVSSDEPIIEPESFLTPDRQIVLAVGRLHQQKGFDLLLKAFAVLSSKFPTWDLVILGEGPERKNLETQGMDLYLKKRFFMPGRVGNMTQWYKRADMFVLSSRYEGFPNALMEAMAHGLPVVSFNCKTGPQELIQHKKNGILVPLDKQVHGLTAALQNLMQKNKLHQEIGVAARGIYEKFSMEYIQSLWNDVLNQES